MDKSKLTQILNELENSINYNETQRDLQVKFGMILKKVYRMAEVGRDKAQTKEDKEFWNELRKCIYDFLYKHWL